MPTLTIEFGEGSAVVLADTLSPRLIEQLLNTVRGFFDSADARAEGWATIPAGTLNEFRATHGRANVIFRVCSQPADAT